MTRKRVALICVFALVIAVVAVTSVCLLRADWEVVRYRYGTDSTRIAYVERGVDDGRFVGWSRQRVMEVLGPGWEGTKPEYWCHIAGKDQKNRQVILVLTFLRDTVVEAEIHASSS